MVETVIFSGAKLAQQHPYKGHTDTYNSSYRYLKRGVSPQFPQVLTQFIDGALVAEFLHNTVQDDGLATDGAPDTGGVIHDDKGEYYGNSEGD
jgi:hypothetical protein